MFVLVTGGAGYVGSRVVAHLLDQGHRVRVFDNFLYGGEPVIALSAFSNVERQVGDVRNDVALRTAMGGVDAVIHLAGIVGEEACNVSPRFSWSVNHDAIPTLVHTVEDSGVSRLVLVSTCSNYGVAGTNLEVDEDAPLKPLSAYARAKVAAEQLALAAKRVPTVSVLRLGTVCGVSPRMRFDLLVNAIARDAVLDREIEIYAPKAWRPFLHIDDAAEALRQVLTADASAVHRCVFNVVGENHQKAGLLEIARRLFPNLRAKVVDRDPDVRDYRVSGERFVKALGLRPSRTVADAFREVADAVRNGCFRDPDWKGHSAVPLTRFPPT